MTQCGRQHLAALDCAGTVIRVIDWSETSHGVESKVVLGWKHVVMDYFNVLVLFRNFWHAAYGYSVVEC